MTDVWTAFVAARLAEDDAGAYEMHRPRGCGTIDRDGGFDPDPFWCSCGYPIRVLRQVTALRVILAEHAPISTPPLCSVCGEYAPCKTLRALAAIWADHPDQPGRRAHQDHSDV